jgi:hypothetical protein
MDVSLLQQGVQPNDANVFYMRRSNKDSSNNNRHKFAIGLRIVFWVWNNDRRLSMLMQKRDHVPKMTNEEMIAWAEFPGTPNADFNTVKYHEAMNRLIWIAQKEARMEVWRNIGKHARMAVDMGLLSSYPGGLLKRQKNDEKK